MNEPLDHSAQLRRDYRTFDQIEQDLKDALRHSQDFFVQELERVRRQKAEIAKLFMECCGR